MPVKDLNEITHHILDCMNSSIHYYSKANGESTDISMASSYGHGVVPGGGMKHGTGGEASFGGLNGFQLNV